MPVIRIDFDSVKVKESEITDLAIAIQKIVADVTEIEDVLVYANSAQININIHPVEIFVHMSAHKISDPERLIGKLREQLSLWKSASDFPHLINLTLVPEPWKIEMNI